MNENQKELACFDILFKCLNKITSIVALLDKLMCFVKFDKQTGCTHCTCAVFVDPCLYYTFT